jgi:hypothetical protein
MSNESNAPAGRGRPACHVRLWYAMTLANALMYGDIAMLLLLLLLLLLLSWAPAAHCAL